MSFSDNTLDMEFNKTDYIFPLFKIKDIGVYGVLGENMFIMLYDKKLKDLKFESFCYFFENNTQINSKDQSRSTLVLEDCVKSLMESAHMRILFYSRLLMKNLEKLH